MGLNAFLRKTAYVAAAGIAYLASYIVPVHGDTIESYLRGDVNRDGIVNIIDLTTVAQHFGETITSPLDPNPDVNGDGIVDILDLVIVGRDYGRKANRSPVIELDGQLFEVQLTFDGQVQKAYDYEVNLPEVIGSKSHFPISAKIYDPDNTTEHPDADPVEVTIEQLDGAGKMAKEYVSRTNTKIITPSFTVTGTNPNITTIVENEWPAYYWYRITATDSNGSETSALARYKVMMDNGGRVLESGILMTDAWSEEVFQTRTNFPGALESISQLGVDGVGVFYNLGYIEIEPLPIFGPKPNLGFNSHTIPLEDLTQIGRQIGEYGLSSILDVQIDINIDLQTGRLLPISRGEVGATPQPPEYWDAWFDQYTTFILPLADLAQSSGTRSLTILDNSNVLRHYDPESDDYPLVFRWSNAIDEIRQRFSGQIGVSQPLFWGKNAGQNFFIGSSDQIGFYDKLDYVQVSFAPGLTDQMNPSVADLQERIGQIIQESLESTAMETGKPIHLNAIFHSSDGANKGGRGPMNFDIPVDMQEQVDQYEALFRAIRDFSYIQAIFSWGYWWSDGFDTLDTFTNWSIRGKPAERAVKLWFDIYK